MDPKFWHERWALNEIGFHQPRFNPFLTEYWPTLLAGEAPGQVFVPLCGKSRDMVWLREQGHSVLGVELSATAITDFFEEQSVPYVMTSRDGSTHYQGQGFELICGDFFDLKFESLEQTQAVYDRAALIALPRPMQDRYVDHLHRVLPKRAPILLITLEYDQDVMAGPPFSIPEERVAELFESQYHIEKLATRDVLEDHPGFKSKGLSWLYESVYGLRPKGI